MGIPVAALIVIAAAASLFMLARGALKSKDRSRSSLAAIAGIAALSYLHSMIDFSLQIPGYLIVFAILLGCGLARSSLEQTTLYKARSRGFGKVRSQAGVVSAVKQQDTAKLPTF
jgi:low temperature requirement protein LtrA